MSEAAVLERPNELIASPGRMPPSNASSRDIVRRWGLDRPVWSLLGTPLDTLTMDETVARLDQAIAGREQLWLGTPNLDWMTMARGDRDFRRSMIAADLSVCDGAPVAILAKMAGIPLTTRVPGSGLFERLREVRAPSGRARSVFFLGGREGSAERAVAALEAEDGGVSAAGHYNPGFGSLDQLSEERHLAPVNEADADIVIVSLSARKGQVWIGRNRDRLNARILAPLGAVVDFTAGTVQRAPGWMQRIGLEWLWRIKEDPALARRYGTNFALLPNLMRRARAARNLVAAQVAALPEAASRAPVATERLGDTSRIALPTDATAEALEPVREALASALDESLSIEVSFVTNSAADLALVGLLQIAADRAERAGKGFVAIDLTRPAARLLSLCGDPIPVRQGSGL